MIVRQPSPESKQDSKDHPVIPSTWSESLHGLRASMVDAAENGLPVHEVEQEIWSQMLALGHKILESFFEQSGTGDLGEHFELPDGRTLRRLPGLYSRPYQSIFGSFELARAVYGKREGQKIELVPLDGRLQLPGGKFSYLLQDWSQYLAVENPYSQVNRSLEKILGFKQSVDSLERMNRKMAVPVVDHLDSLPPPPAEEEAELMVSSADGKGVPLRKPTTTAPIHTHAPSSGPEPDKKKIALLGVSYTVDRFYRTPEEVVASLFRKSDATNDNKKPRGRPQHKRLRASLERGAAGTMQPAMDEVFGWLTREAEERNSSGTKPHLVLMDGQRSLWDAAEATFSEDRIEILDLLHVTPRLWKAAYLFHPRKSAEATRFVRDRCLRVLQGKSTSVVRGLRRMATNSGLKGRKRSKLERICRYLENNVHRMLYNEYLAAGYPIATGVIEGACRHLVKDRLERSGMQWTMEGAQAMLDLRSVHLMEHWGAFQDFWVANENERLYPQKDLLDHVKWPFAA